MSQRDIRRLIRDDNPRSPEADEGDEHPDADADRPLEVLRHRPDDGLPHPPERHQKEKYPGEKYRAQRHLPRQVQRPDDIIRKERVKPHPRGQRDGIIRHKPHHKRCQRRHPDCRRNRGFLRYAGIRQDIGIDKQNIGDGNKRRKTG